MRLRADVEDLATSASPIRLRDSRRVIRVPRMPSDDRRLLRAIAARGRRWGGHPTVADLSATVRLRLSSAFSRGSAAGVALEINSQVDRLDLDDVHARLAHERGVRLVIDSDAHSPAGLGALRWGVAVARRAWLQPDDVLNTRPLEAFRALLRRNRR